MHFALCMLPASGMSTNVSNRREHSNTFEGVHNTTTNALKLTIASEKGVLG